MLRSSLRQQLAVLAVEKEAQLLHHLGVGFGRRQTVHTGPETGAHVVVEAGSRELAVDLDLAGANLKVGPRKIHQLARHPLPHEGPEIGVAVILDPPRELDPRPRLAGGQLEVGIGLVVPEHAR